MHVPKTPRTYSRILEPFRAQRQGTWEAGVRALGPPLLGFQPTFGEGLVAATAAAHAAQQVCRWAAAKALEVQDLGATVIGKTLA